MARKKRRSSRKKKSQRTKSPDTTAPPPDRRAMERTLADIHTILQGQDFESVEDINEVLQKALAGGIPARTMPQTDLARAQDVMYDAFEAGGAKAVKLARKALEISPDCADAYVLLAEQEADTHEEAASLYEQGVEAGERALGEEAFEELKGEFWGWIETRPYMRARCGLAMCLWEMGRRKEAVQHLQEMVELNPNDNQGLRMILCFWLLELRRDVELGALLKQFDDDGSLDMLWAKAIWTFRTEGPGRTARRRVREALERNPMMMHFLLGTRPIPDTMPEYIEMGGPDEAASTASALMQVLDRQEDAAEWLVDELYAALDDVVGTA